MWKQIIPLLLLLNSYLFVDSFAQEMPLVYPVENTGADCPKPPLLSFDQLPTIQALPDPFAWSDGRGRISGFSDWRYRRAEISAEVQRYELGTKPAPPSPSNLEASFSQGKLTVTVQEGTNSVTLTATITLPTSGSGPFPAVIGVGSGTGSLPADIFTSRGVATIQYNFGEVAPWTQGPRGQGGFYKLYPDPKVGYFTAWAWGISRIIDGLERVQEANIDIKHLAVTGCSFAGKIALFAGALDERIALTIPQEPGGGGDAAWRVTETLSGSRETLSKAQSYGWYYQDVSLFNNAVTKLPYDHHEVMAMIAPRALFVLGNPTQEWLADESGYVACKAAQEVWKALGVLDRFGFSKVGDHAHCALPNSQRPEVGAFVEKFLLGEDSTNTSISTNPGYTTDLSSWMNWTTPTLSNTPSYFSQASLVYPSNLQEGLEKSITFRWNKVGDAGKYLFQLSVDPTFASVSISDSTTADTLKTITGLLDGKRYFWRVQVKNSSGSPGPWSDVWSFITFIPLPTIPQLVAATPYPNREGWITFKWKNVKDADHYVIQLSDVQSFAMLMSESTASDTVKTLMGFSEGQKYYWRVQARNVAGSGPWSDVSNFTLVLPPTDLGLRRSGNNEITLTWIDHSRVEDGYVIERMQSLQTVFSLLDTLKGSGTEYVDKKVEQAQTYTYRIKAYQGPAESGYSNEASLFVVVGVNEEAIPTEYSISQNYPNPFNPSTTITYKLPRMSHVSLCVYNTVGQLINVLVDENKPAGVFSARFDAAILPSGVYFYRLQAGEYLETKKMLLLR